jgi:hypothetical protein
MAAEGFSGDAMPEAGGSRTFTADTDWGDSVDDDLHPIDRLLDRGRGGRTFW